MNIHLLKGNFLAQDAKELLTKIVHIKIGYHEKQIAKDGNANEEDIKMREKRIIELQNELKAITSNLNEPNKLVELLSNIEVKLTN